MEVTPVRIKELRERTGAGMMDCKKALLEADGDMEAAVDVLRKKGLADLAKKSGRATNEGVIDGLVTDDGAIGVLVEVNCETDFVARNASFKELVADIAAQIAKNGAESVADLLVQPFIGRPEITIQERLGEAVAKLGENMSIARFVRYELSTDAGFMTVYIHGVGNIGVLVEVSAESRAVAATEAAHAFAKDIAMQIAAVAPIAVRPEDIPSDVIEHELSIYKAQAAESGKPEAIQEKIAQGRLNKFYKEVCLLEQSFVKDPEKSVRQYRDACSKIAGGALDVVRFTRMVLGETSDTPRSACSCQ